MSTHSFETAPTGGSKVRRFCTACGIAETVAANFPCEPANVAAIVARVPAEHRTARVTRDLCQTHWQDANPGSYFPDGARYGTCDQCGDDALVSRSWLADESGGIATGQPVKAGDPDGSDPS